MNLCYRKATLDDLEILTKTRIEVLRAANQLHDDADMSQVECHTRAYYQHALADGTHLAYLVWDGAKVVGTGAVSYYQVMPTYHNPTGQKAYIMNMYTHPDYRRKGIASKTLSLLVADAREKGIADIGLEATDMGRPLYEQFGFTQAAQKMTLPAHRE